MIHQPPYETVLKPFGEALVELARRRTDVVCLGADLTRQTETDLFRDALPQRFFNVGMAEANAIGIAGGLARAGHTVFFATFGVFATRRCFDQLAMAIAYPGCRVTIAGFMPGLSSPGHGHQTAALFGTSNSAEREMLPTGFPFSVTITLSESLVSMAESAS